MSTVTVTCYTVNTCLNRRTGTDDSESESRTPIFAPSRGSFSAHAEKNVCDQGNSQHDNENILLWQKHFSHVPRSNCIILIQYWTSNLVPHVLAV